MTTDPGLNPTTLATTVLALAARSDRRVESVRAELALRVVDGLLSRLKAGEGFTLELPGRQTGERPVNLRQGVSRQGDRTIDRVLPDPACRRSGNAQPMTLGVKIFFLTGGSKENDRTSGDARDD